VTGHSHQVSTLPSPGPMLSIRAYVLKGDPAGVFGALMKIQGTAPPQKFALPMLANSSRSAYYQACVKGWRGCRSLLCLSCSNQGRLSRLLHMGPQTDKKRNVPASMNSRRFEPIEISSPKSRRRYKLGLRAQYRRIGFARMRSTDCVEANHATSR
jgi:hypothetical protein